MPPRKIKVSEESELIANPLTTRKYTKKQTTRRTTSRIVGIECVKITNAEQLAIYKPPQVQQVHPRIWELTNRKTFYNWLHAQYGIYEIGSKRQQRIQYERELTTYQKLVRDFIQTESPYRGLLLYHGLGVGKSCSSIAISQSLLDKRRVLFISKAALEKNYRNELLTCDGSADYMRRNHHWVFIKGETSEEQELIRDLEIPDEIVRINRGAYVVNHTIKKSNFDELSDKHQLGLMGQITALIDARIKFIHHDDPHIIRRFKDGDYDNCVIIIDEAHGLINGMATGIPKGTHFYQNLMNAKNSKIILLSGTPLINKIYESAFLYNILRGYIPTIVYKIVPDFGRPIEWQTIKSKLLRIPHVDQVIADTIKKQVKITKNPDGFINDVEGGGVIYAPEKSVDLDTFKTLVHAEMLRIKDTVKFNKFVETFENNTCLPTDELEFQKMFYNPDLNKMRNTEVFKKRIAGLTSYYDRKASTEYPTLKPINLVSLPMSNYQLAKYQTIRIKEIEKEKRQMLRRKKNDEVLMSSYRIGSRLYCTFVFPEEIGSPYEIDKLELYENLENILEPSIESGESTVTDTIASAEEALKKVNLVNSKYLDVLRKESAKYMSLKGQLGMLSPKYKAIIELLQKSKGCCLLYSQFISLIGLKTFAIALDTTGQYAPLEIKKESGEYVLVENQEHQGKLRYIFYSGDNKDKELRDIYRIIFNSQYEALPPSCLNLRRRLESLYGAEQNLQGQIIKLMMTTASGAEGLNLANVRRVFIMEPYWQPVLTEQVIGRAVRKGSHLRLPAEDRNVEVFIFMVHITTDQLKNITSGAIRQDVATYPAKSYNKLGKVVSSDEELYIISERKKDVITEAQGLIRESAFDCTLNYSDNREKYPSLTCLNYNTKNRNLYESYLSTASLADTVDVVEVNQEYEIPVEYGKFKDPRQKTATAIFGKTRYLYVLLNPQPNAKRYIYDESIIKLARAKPIGEMLVINGKQKPRFYKTKTKG
jgi:hypothetical protein